MPVTRHMVRQPWLRVAPPPVIDSPDDVAGLAAWYDASDSSTITHSGGAVSEWRDKSGNDRHLVQATGSAQPTTGTRTQNGLNVIDFTAVNDFMKANGLSGLGGNVLTAFLVFQWESGSQNFARTICLAPSGGEESFVTDGISVLQRRTGDAWAIAYNANTSAAITLAADTPAITTTRRDGDALSLWLDDGSPSTTSGVGTGNFAITDFFLAGRYDGETSNSPLDGWFAEILIYLAALAAAEREAIRNLLNTKWAVF